MATRVMTAEEIEGASENTPVPVRTTIPGETVEVIGTAPADLSKVTEDPRKFVVTTQSGPEIGPATVPQNNQVIEEANPTFFQGLETIARNTPPGKAYEYLAEGETTPYASPEKMGKAAYAVGRVAIPLAAAVAAPEISAATKAWPLLMSNMGFAAGEGVVALLDRMTGRSENLPGQLAYTAKTASPAMAGQAVAEGAKALGAVNPALRVGAGLLGGYLTSAVTNAIEDKFFGKEQTAFGEGRVSNMTGATSGALAGALSYVTPNHGEKTAFVRDLNTAGFSGVEGLMDAGDVWSNAMQTAMKAVTAPVSEQIGKIRGLVDDYLVKKFPAVKEVRSRGDDISKALSSTIDQYEAMNTQMAMDAWQKTFGKTLPESSAELTEVALRAKEAADLRTGAKMFQWVGENMGLPKELRNNLINLADKPADIVGALGNPTQIIESLGDAAKSAAAKTQRVMSDKYGQAINGLNQRVSIGDLKTIIGGIARTRGKSDVFTKGAGIAPAKTRMENAIRGGYNAMKEKAKEASEAIVTAEEYPELAQFLGQVEGAEQHTTMKALAELRKVGTDAAGRTKGRERALIKKAVGALDGVMDNLGKDSEEYANYVAMRGEYSDYMDKAGHITQRLEYMPSANVATLFTGYKKNIDVALEYMRNAGVSPDGVKELVRGSRLYNAIQSGISGDTFHPEKLVAEIGKSALSKSERNQVIGALREFMGLGNPVKKVLEGDISGIAEMAQTDHAMRKLYSDVMLDSVARRIYKNGHYNAKEAQTLLQNQALLEFDKKHVGGRLQSILRASDGKDSDAVKAIQASLDLMRNSDDPTAYAQIFTRGLGKASLDGVRKAMAGLDNVLAASNNVDFLDEVIRPGFVQHLISDVADSGEVVYNLHKMANLPSKGTPEYSRMLIVMGKDGMETVNTLRDLGKATEWLNGLERKFTISGDPTQAPRKMSESIMNIMGKPAPMLGSAAVLALLGGNPMTAGALGVIGIFGEAAPHIMLSQFGEFARKSLDYLKYAHKIPASVFVTRSEKAKENKK